MLRKIAIAASAAAAKGQVATVSVVGGWTVTNYHRSGRRIRASQDDACNRGRSNDIRHYHGHEVATVKKCTPTPTGREQVPAHPYRHQRGHATTSRAKTTSSREAKDTTHVHEPSFLALRRVFDEHAYWTAAAKYRPPRQEARSDGTVLHGTGLFMIPALAEPKGLLQLAQGVHEQCQGYIQRIIVAHTKEGGTPSSGTSSAPDTTLLSDIVGLLDELSDSLVSIMDMCEFLRHYHPDPAFADAADKVIYSLGNYMNQLNTDARIYQALMRVFQEPAAYDRLSVEAKMVARVLRHDFEQSGVHLDVQTKTTSISLNNRILERGTEFQRLAHAKQKASQDDALMQNMAQLAPEDREEVIQMIRLPMRYQDIKGLPDACKTYIRSIHQRRRAGTRSSEDTLFPMTDYTTSCVLSFAKPEAIRQQVYMASYQANDAQLEALEDLLTARYSLARLHGYPTFAHYYLKDKTIHDPEVVMEFLKNMSERTRPLAEKELLPLRRLKARHLSMDVSDDASLPVLYAWDRLYYTRLHHQQQQQQQQPALGSITLSHYFSIGRCMEGLSRLFHALYGIRLVPAATRDGELWDPTVRKLHVMDDGDGTTDASPRHLGTIYCDVFARHGKPDSAAHYTIRCGKRKKSHLHVNGAADNVLWSETVHHDHADPTYRSPIVVIVAGFGYHATSNPSHLLQWSEVDSLAHEMGHAIHSMLAHTEYHNVAGTRCKIDFVEVPSILMEYFLRDYHVVATFARHYQTGALLPREAFEAHVKATRRFEHLDQMHAIHHAYLDQLCHGDLATLRQQVMPPNAAASTSGLGSASPPFQRWSRYFSNHLYVKSQIASQHPIPAVQGTSWQATFTHLFGYGGGYYSYLLCRLIAREIYQGSGFERMTCATASEAPGLDLAAYRRAGERLRRYVLSQGGARDPRELLQAFFQDLVATDPQENAPGMGERLPFMKLDRDE